MEFAVKVRCKTYHDWTLSRGQVLEGHEAEARGHAHPTCPGGGAVKWSVRCSEDGAVHPGAHMVPLR